MWSREEEMCRFSRSLRVRYFRTRVTLLCVITNAGSQRLGSVVRK